MHTSTYLSSAELGRRMWRAFVACLAVSADPAAVGRQSAMTSARRSGQPARRTLSERDMPDLGATARGLRYAEGFTRGADRAYQAAPQLPQPAGLVLERAADRWGQVRSAADDIMALLNELLPDLERHFGAPQVRRSGTLLRRAVFRAQHQSARATLLIANFSRQRPVGAMDDLSRRLAGLAGITLHEFRQVAPHIDRLSAYQESVGRDGGQKGAQRDLARRVDVLLRLLHGP